MQEPNFYLNFDRAVQAIHTLKTIRLSQLLSEEVEKEKDKIRAELDQLNEEKRLLYSLNADATESFIQILMDKYFLIQS
jgi:hypothetical protein